MIGESVSMAKWTFSTILYVDQEELFQTAFSSLKSSALFPEKVQLIVVDPYGFEQVRAACKGYANVVYLPVEDAEIAVAYNQGLRHVSGTYLNFSLASATYSSETYEKVASAFDQYPVQMVSVCPYLIDQDGSLVPYGGGVKGKEPEEDISLNWQYGKIQMAFQAYFFRANLFQGRFFDETLHSDALHKCLLELQLEYPRYCYLSEVYYQYTVSLEDNTSTNPIQYQLWWYHDSVTKFITPLLRSAQERFGQVPLFLQKACYYLIYAKYNCNLNDRNKGVMETKDEVLQFVKETFQALTYIDNTIIMGKNLTSYSSANRAVRMFLLRGKADVLGKELHITDVSRRYMALLENPEGKTDSDYRNHVVVIAPNNRELLRIRIMNYEDGMLQIDANVGLADFLSPDQYKVYALSSTQKKKEPEVYEPEQLQVYPLTKCFGFTFQRKAPLQFRIPVKKAAQQHIQFYYEFEGRQYQFRITFDTPNSRMIPKSKYSYWMFQDNWMVTWYRSSELIIRKVDWFYHLKRELLFCWDVYQSAEDKALSRRGILLRMMYWLKRPAYQKKHVWITFDKLYKAGDNGEYMYHYCRENQKDVEIYYIIRRESPDYERMVREDKKHVLVHGTFRCQLITLLAEVYLATHANISAQYNNSPEYRTYTKDLQRGEIVCIQHGLTIQKIAQYQNRQFDNTKLYCCASPYEIKNMSHPIYGYDPEVLKLIGMARYDGLVNRDQKIILITPSWRRNVVNSAVANTRRAHNNNFKNSAYFRIYNRLINDERLIRCAKKNGYRIVYLLHPAMSAQIDDFDRNDYVELVPATGSVSYEKILCESSLMVTDYSGVQFDFAYMRKPIVYYHPDELPPHYEEGGLIYSTMGFGPICTGHEQLVDELCASMEQQCRTEEKYIKRADDFFAFDDHNNCQRIFQEVWDWMERRREDR